MTFKELFSNIGDAFGRAGSFFINMKIEDFFSGTLSIVIAGVVLGIFFWIIFKFKIFYNFLFEKIKNPWIRVLLNYWTWIILLLPLCIFMIIITSS